MLLKGEKALLLAILERAAADFKSAVREDRISARHWVLHWEEWDTEEPFTFPWVCNHLDICPHQTMRTIKDFNGQFKRTITSFPSLIEKLFGEGKQHFYELPKPRGKHEP